MDKQPPVKPLPKEVLDRIYKEIAAMTPEEKAKEAEELKKRFSGFAKLYKDRPMV